MYLTAELMDDMDNDIRWASITVPAMHDDWDECLLPDTLDELRY